MRRLGKTSTIFNRTRFTVTGAEGVPNSTIESPELREHKNTSFTPLRSLNTPINQPGGGARSSAAKNQMVDLTTSNT